MSKYTLKAQESLQAAQSLTQQRQAPLRFEDVEGAFGRGDFNVLRGRMNDRPFPLLRIVRVPT